MTGGLRTKGVIKHSSADKPLLSVITVVYNGAALLEDTILSVIDQPYPNIEYIVIDGGSNDGTVDVIRKYEDKIDYWLSEHDSGIYPAMNKAMAKTTGDWINFMNCGDRFKAGVISRFFENRQYDCDILYGDAIVEYTTFEKLWRNMPLEQMWKRTPFCHQACFVRANLMKEWGFDERFKLSSDFDFLYKAYLSGKKFLHVPEVVCYYDYTDGLSIRHELSSLSERRKSVLQHGFSLHKWFYYVRVSGYTRIVTVIKKTIGKRLTGWVTRLLKK